MDQEIGIDKWPWLRRKPIELFTKPSKAVSNPKEQPTLFFLGIIFLLGFGEAIKTLINYNVVKGRIPQLLSSMPGKQSAQAISIVERLLTPKGIAILILLSAVGTIINIFFQTIILHFLLKRVFRADSIFSLTFKIVTIAWSPFILKDLLSAIYVWQTGLIINQAKTPWNFIADNFNVFLLWSYVLLTAGITSNYSIKRSKTSILVLSVWLVGAASYYFKPF